MAVWPELLRNKARSVGPGRLSAQPWCRPKGVRAQLCVWFWLGDVVIS
jgi:hypothetical protein